MRKLLLKTFKIISSKINRKTIKVKDLNLKGNQLKVLVVVIKFYFRSKDQIKMKISI